MLKNKTKNKRTDPYHPSDLFNLNGEGITWEETKQDEQDENQHISVRGLACLLIIAADIVFYPADAIMHDLEVFGVPVILFVGPILGVLSLWAFATLIWLCAYLYVSAIVRYRKYLKGGNNPTGSIEDDVLNYVRDNSNNLKQHIDRILLCEEEQKRFGRDDFNSYCYFSKRLEKLRSNYPKPVGKLSAHTITRTPVYLPIMLDDKNLTVYVVHPENFPYKHTLSRSDRFGKASTKFKFSIRHISLESINNIEDYFEALPDLFAEEYMRDALTAYIYAEHQYYEVEKTAKRVLPEWTDDDSVLLEDYSSLRRWYANYIANCKSRIIELIEDYARDLEFKNDQKKTRSEAIRKALTV